MIRLLVDSASDYTQEEIRNKNLYFVPLQIQIEGKNYLDGVDIDKETFYEKMMNSKEFFKTSQPSPQEFLDIFEEVKKKQETLICLSLSSKLSGTYQSACLAKDMVDYENIYIVDTLTAVAGIRLLCEVAINWIDEKRSVENREERMKEIKKWSVKDVITTVLLSAVLIVIQLLVNMVCMVNDFVSMVLSVGIATFLCAPVYMLMVSRIGKRFVTLIYMTLLGAIFFLMGNWFLLPYFIVVGFLCEAILWKQGSCDNSNRMTASWTVASFLYNGINLLPIWFFWETYYDFAISSGMEQSYIESYVHYYTAYSWIVFILLFTTLMGFLGCMLGRHLIHRHFKKAGVL